MAVAVNGSLVRTGGAYRFRMLHAVSNGSFEECCCAESATFHRLQRAECADTSLNVQSSPYQAGRIDAKSPKLPDAALRQNPLKQQNRDATRESNERKLVMP